MPSEFRVWSHKSPLDTGGRGLEGKISLQMPPCAMGVTRRARGGVHSPRQREGLRTGHPQASAVYEVTLRAGVLETQQGGASGAPSRGREGAQRTACGKVAAAGAQRAEWPVWKPHDGKGPSARGAGRRRALCTPGVGFGAKRRAVCAGRATVSWAIATRWQAGAGHAGSSVPGGPAPNGAQRQRHRVWLSRNNGSYT